MTLTRLYAYAIEPLKHSEEPPAPTGGAIAISADLRTTFEGLAGAAEMRIQVDFAVDTTTRTNETRNQVLRFAFGNGPEARAAASALAARLSSAMDQRSSSCLLVLGALREVARTRVVLWTFPQEEALRLRGGKDSTIEVLTDVFNLRSRLRKAGVFEGRDRRGDFYRGRVLDFQAASPTRQAADFWIADFLDCVLALHGEAGTRELAKCVRRAYEAAKTPAEKEPVYAAIMSVRASPRPRWSLRAFATTYLAGATREAFLRAASNDAIVESDFDFSREVFDRSLNFRVFRLEGDVYVSAPFDQIGHNARVVLTEAGEGAKHLRCEGTVVEESVKARHA